MREIVLDTETTGLDPRDGHRIVEIGCVELVNHVPTGGVYQTYLNPDRELDEGAAAVTGLTFAMLRDKPRFPDVVDAFLDFLGDSPLVIHNAAFDLGFLNAELGRLPREPLPPERAIDTLAIAKQKFPTAPRSLDALCKRFRIDRTARVKHGALLDAQLLAEVYLELLGGRQKGLGLLGDAGGEATAAAHARQRQRPTPLPPLLTPDEAAAHAAFIETLGGDPLWKS
ncbi:MAG: DNA polymerase III subunit epsilon [Alphaproteobacteria bacterium]|nr:DNA polymerase III subunit epsilon [Alphaproteobacteria bacterium]